MNGIVNTTITLGENPQMGQAESLLSDRSEEFRYLVHKHYKVIYWINKESLRIEIANVFDCRQNPEKMQETNKSTPKGYKPFGKKE